MNKLTLTVYFDDCTTHPDTKHAKRIVLSVHAIIYTLTVIEQKFNDIESALLKHRESQISKGQAATKPRECTMSMMSTSANKTIGMCWELIDWTDRLRKLLGYAAGLKKQDDWYKTLIEALNSVKKLRHFTQHFDGELNKYVGGSFPLMGSIFAAFPTVDGICMHLLISYPPKTPYDNTTEIHDFYVPEKIVGNIDEITFCLEKNSINISSLFRSIEHGKQYLIAHLEKEYKFTWPILEE